MRNSVELCEPPLPRSRARRRLTVRACYLKMRARPRSVLSSLAIDVRGAPDRVGFPSPSVVPGEETGFAVASAVNFTVRSLVTQERGHGLELPAQAAALMRDSGVAQRPCQR